MDTPMKRALRELKEATDQMFDPRAPKSSVELDPDFFIWDTQVTGIRMVCAPPWIHTLYMGEMDNRRLNAALAYKKLQYEEDREAEKWGSIIFVLAERPYRVEVLAEHAEEMDDDEYWEILGGVWTDSENVWQHLDLYRELFAADRPMREMLMDEAEKEALEKLPDPIPVFHGVDGSEFAWTTSKKVAEWFAQRFPEEGHVPRLRSGLAPKEHVIAHFLGRGEEEVLIFPEHILNMTEVVLEEVRDGAQT